MRPLDNPLSSRPLIAYFASITKGKRQKTAHEFFQLFSSLRSTPTRALTGQTTVYASLGCRWTRNRDWSGASSTRSYIHKIPALYTRPAESSRRPAQRNRISISVDSFDRLLHPTTEHMYMYTCSFFMSGTFRILGFVT